TCYGICVSVGLQLIGVPNAALWGLLSGVLRFVPYVGPWAGALLPVLLSFAISTSWFTPLMTIALFIVLEVIVSNFIEPWVYGANTGVSPLALIISAVFWTWLWGPVGLVLSTPMTVCLAVMGRHVPRLEFLGILLSEDQPLAPQEEFVERTVEAQPECICVSVLPPTSIAQARHLASATRERRKSVTILVGVWSARFDGEKLRERLRGAHVSDVAVSLADAVQRVSKMTAAITDAMLPAPTPPNEEERLAELNGLNLLDTPREADFDQVTARLTRLFKVPMALVTLVDEKRQWFKSQAGLP